MARICLDSGQLPDYGGEKPHLHIHLTAEALTGNQPGAGRGDWNEILDMTYIAQLACDAAIVRIMMNGRSEILDVGRATRVISPAIRRALVARSGGRCEFPGCHRPHRWCDAHHLTPWDTADPPTWPTSHSCAASTTRSNTEAGHSPAAPTDRGPPPTRRDEPSPATRPEHSHCSAERAVRAS